MPKPYTEFQKEIAFDVYYALGEARNLNTLSQHLVNTEGFREGSPKFDTLKTWSRRQNWQTRVKQRDIENARKVQAGTDREVVNTKADYRKGIAEDIKELMLENGYLARSYGTAKKKLEDPEDESLDVRSVNQLTELARAMQGNLAKKIELIKLDLLLMGEADSREEHTGTVTLIEVLRAKRQAKNDHNDA